MDAIFNWLAFIINKIIKKARFSAIKNSKISSLAVIHSGSLIVNSVFDRYSYCGYDCTIINADIGPFCSVAGNVSIGGAAHPIQFVSTSPVFLSHKDSVKKKFANFDYLPCLRTTIGADVWIGEGAFLKAGINVGIGSIIGMGAVVTKDIPPYTIVGGNPAKILRKRFPDEIIVGLMKLQWWELSENDLKNIAHLFDNPEALLKSKGLL